MPAGVNDNTDDRTAFEVTWNPSDYEGNDITIVGVNPVTGEESNKSGPNDGSMTWTVPEGHSGATNFKISDDFDNFETLEVVYEDGAVVSVENTTDQSDDDGHLPDSDDDENHDAGE